MLPANNRSISIRQIAAATSLVALLACLAVSLKRNSIDSRVSANRDELVVIVPNPTAVRDVRLVTHRSVQATDKSVEEKGANAELSSYANVLTFGPISDPNEPVYTSSLFSPFEVLWTPRSPSP